MKKGLFLFMLLVVLTLCSACFVFAVNGSCTYGSTIVQNNTFGLNKDDRFICLNGNWYDWTNVRDEKYWGFSNPAELCRSYGSFFAGMFGGYNGTNNGFKRWLPGSAKNYLCARESYCNVNSSCISCIENKECPPGTDKDNNKKVFAFYFTWYNCYRAPCENFQTCNYVDSLLEVKPIFGLDKFVNELNVDMYKADFIRMNRAGIDVAVVINWLSSINSTKQLTKINMSLSELKSERKSFPKVSLFLGRSHIGDLTYLNLSKEEDRQTFGNEWARRNEIFFEKFNKDFYFKHNGKYLVWIYDAPTKNYIGVNCPILRAMKQKFVSDGYDVFVVAPMSYGHCEVVDAFHNWGQGGGTIEAKQDCESKGYPYCAGGLNDLPVSEKIDVCEVMPGFERPKFQECKNLSIITHSRSNGTFFKNSWEYCLKHNDGWIAVETWNEYVESTAIAPVLSEPATDNIYNPYLYSRINAKYSSIFKGTTNTWPRNIECEIDEECFINGNQTKCINGRCNDPYFVSCDSRVDDNCGEPETCIKDGICDPIENCSSCPHDCGYCNSLLNNIVLYFPFENEEGDQIDYSFNNGSTFYDNRSRGKIFSSAGKVGSASVHFDGNTSISVGKKAIGFAKLNNSYTIALWVKLDPLANKSLRYYITSAGWSYALSYDNGHWDYLTETVNQSEKLLSQSVSSSIQNPEKNVWYFLTVTFNGTSMDLYVNGTRYGTKSLGYYNQQREIFVPGLYLGGSYISKGFFMGDIDEFRVYSRALSNDEIQKLYAVNSILCPFDYDGDGYSSLGGECGAVDCDDNNPMNYLGAGEICDGKDNNCDGQIDEGNVCRTSGDGSSSYDNGYSSEGGSTNLSFYRGFELSSLNLTDFFGNGNDGSDIDSGNLSNNNLIKKTMDKLLLNIWLFLIVLVFVIVILAVIIGLFHQKIFRKKRKVIPINEEVSKDVLMKTFHEKNDGSLDWTNFYMGNKK
ncbi:MAG: LamG-like jellyroll fold domain-containing protein [Candidatus Pacearchaeota archaeon]